MSSIKLLILIQIQSECFAIIGFLSSQLNYWRLQMVSGGQHSEASKHTIDFSVTLFNSKCLNSISMHAIIIVYLLSNLFNWPSSVGVWRRHGNLCAVRERERWNRSPEEIMIGDRVETKYYTISIFQRSLAGRLLVLWLIQFPFLIFQITRSLSLRHVWNSIKQFFALFDPVWKFISAQAREIAQEKSDDRDGN